MKNGTTKLNVLAVHLLEGVGIAVQQVAEPDCAVRLAQNLGHGFAGGREDAARRTVVVDGERRPVSRFTNARSTSAYSGSKAEGMRGARSQRIACGFVTAMVTRRICGARKTTVSVSPSPFSTHCAWKTWSRQAPLSAWTRVPFTCVRRASTSAVVSTRAVPRRTARGVSRTQVVAHPAHSASDRSNPQHFITTPLTSPFPCARSVADARAARA